MIAVKHLHVTHFDRMLCAFQVQSSDDSNTHLFTLLSWNTSPKRGKMYIIEKTTLKKICGHFCDYIMVNIVFTYMYSLFTL